MKNATAGPTIGERAKSPRSRGILTLAYLAHLGVPAFLLADIATARLRHEIVLKPATVVAAVAAISAVWLAVGLGLFFRSRDRGAFLERARTPLTAVYAIYFGIFVIEGVARLIWVTPPIPTAHEPFLKGYSPMDPNLTPGVSGKKMYTTNALGLRGPMPPVGGGGYKIVMIGGSTTICTNLDDSEEWPHLVMQDMNARSKGPHVWTGNAGQAAAHTINHLVLMQWMPGVLRPDMVVFLIGVNDLGTTLASEGASTQALLEKQAGYEGDLPAGTHWRSVNVYPLYRRLRLFLVFHIASENLKLRLHPPNPLQILIPSQLGPLRHRREVGQVLPLPDLSVGLKEYRGRILALAARCKDLEMRCLFLTQPSMWRSNQTASEERLFWFGIIGPFDTPKGFVSSANMALAMDSYNRTLLDVCQQNGLECFDIAARIPKDTSSFFDEQHFNEPGARAMAQNLTEYLLSRAPFSTAHQ
jgi:lysophospholipase L1-like esterase